MKGEGERERENQEILFRAKGGDEGSRKSGGLGAKEREIEKKRKRRRVSWIALFREMFKKKAKEETGGLCRG